MDPQRAASDTKPHVVCVPLPSQGQLKAMIDMAKLLHHRGFHITIAITEFIHKRLLESSSSNSLLELPGFRFAPLIGVPPLGADLSTSDTKARVEAIWKGLLGPLRDLLAKLNCISSWKAPPVSCIVSDGLVSASHIVAQELGVPLASYFTFSGSTLMLIKHSAALREKGLVPIKDESCLTNGYLDQLVDWVPGMKDVRLRDFPGIVRTIEDPNGAMCELCSEAMEKASQTSSEVVVHSFHELEQEVLDALSAFFPRVYAIGPIPILLKEVPQDSPLNSIGHSLWKEDTVCLQWLDSWPPDSVIYVNFGSIAVVNPQQLIEFAWGLTNSKHPFLWIIRPDLVMGDVAILPAELVADTKERGMVTSWCLQDKVLKHPSVGGFLTHSGWNSTIESISAGVPMLCWPFMGDQHMNCRCTCKEWEIGMEIDNEVKREGVEKLVRELMEGEKGKKMRNKAMEWKRKSEEATGVHGSSTLALDKLIHEVLLRKQ